MTKAMKRAGAMLGLLLWGAAHAGTVTYVYTDAQGTPVMESDAQGHITARYEYTPYGVVVTSVGAAPDGVGYTGHVNDPETGLVYMQARYYDPGRGGFLSVDPVGPSPGDVFGFNRYAYAGNNPIKNVDPDGRAFGVDDLIGSAVGGLVGVGFEAGKDLVTGHSMTWGDAAGSFAGGALMGEGIVNAPETLGGSVAVAVAARGAVVGLVSNTVQQTTDIATGDQKSYSVTSAVVSTAVGAVSAGIVSKVGTVKVPGISSGRGNMAAVAKAVKTRIANGNASSMSAKTIAKGVIGGQVGDAGKTAVGGTIDAAKTTVCNHTGGC
ncbi:MAG: RHS repeat-associated core domain-containing protein [Rhodanobacter sp.]